MRTSCQLERTSPLLQCARDFTDRVKREKWGIFTGAILHSPRSSHPRASPQAAASLSLQGTYHAFDSLDSSRRSLSSHLRPSLFVPAWQASLRAEDLDQLLKAAAERARTKAEGEKSDKTDKKAEEESDEAKEETNGAKKDEDTAAKPAAKPAAESRPTSRSRSIRRMPKCSRTREKIEGLIKLYRKDDQLFAELGPRQLDRDYIVLISIARGIGQTPILGGMSWGFGDDWVWQFRKVGENIQLVRRNVRFTAEQRQPDRAGREGRLHRQRAVQPADHARRARRAAFVVDLTPVFMSDLPQIGMVLPGFAFSPQTSRPGPTSKGLPKNVELQVAATYASGGMQQDRHRCPIAAA